MHAVGLMGEGDDRQCAGRDGERRHSPDSHGGGKWDQPEAPRHPPHHGRRRQERGERRGEEAGQGERRSEEKTAAQQEQKRKP